MNHLPTPPTADAETTRKLITLQSLRQLQLLRTQWRKLELTCGSQSAFQSFDWCYAYCQENYGFPSTSPHVIAGFESDELVFIWPLMTVQIFGLNILRCLSEPFGQYGDILCAPQSDPELWLKKSKAQIKASNRFHGIRLRHVREDSRAFAYLQRNFQRVGSIDAAPFLDLKQYQDEIAYAKRYTKIQRRRRQKIHKDLEKIGPLTFKVLTQGAPLSSAVSHAIEAKRHWLVKHGRYSAAVFSAILTEILNTVAHTADSNVRVVATVLRAGDEEVSFEIGLRYKDRHYAYLTAHQPALTDASPGRLHMDYSQRNALNSGFAFFDLLIPLDPHKTSWSSGRISASDYWLPLTLRGSLYGRAYLVVLRPLLRQLVHLSPEILRKAAGLLLRQLHRRSR